MLLASGKAKKQLELTEREVSSNLIVKGTVSWLSAGIRIQEMQYVVNIIII
jgi:hypothetical protein